MSTLDDDLSDISRAPTQQVPSSRLVEVRCLGCQRRFSTDVGLCPWCGHSSTVAVAPPRAAEPPYPPAPPRPERGPTNPTLIAVAVVIAVAVAVGLAAWIVAGRGSGAATRSTAPVTATTGAAGAAGTAVPPLSAAPPAATTSATTSATTEPSPGSTAASPGSTANASGTGDPAAQAAARTVADYTRAITERDWARARALVPTVPATDADYATLYGATRSVQALVLATAGTESGSVFVYAGQVVVESSSGVTSSRLLCARYDVDPATSTITNVRITPLGTVAGDVTPEAVSARLHTCPAN